jgi:hypothetical protein
LGGGAPPPPPPNPHLPLLIEKIRESSVINRAISPEARHCPCIKACCPSNLPIVIVSLTEAGWELISRILPNCAAGKPLVRTVTCPLSLDAIYLISSPGLIVGIWKFDPSGPTTNIGL